MSTAVITSYVKETLARFQGNTDQVVAEQNFRIAVASLKGQIASLEAKRVKVENKLAVAEEAFKAAKYPTERITNEEAYLSNIVRAKEELDRINSELESIDLSIEFNAKLKAEYES